MRATMYAAVQPDAATKIVGITPSTEIDTAMVDMLVTQSKEHPELIFMYGDKTMDLYDRAKEHFDVMDEAKLPVYIANTGGDKWHLFNAEVDALPQFIADFKAGALEKTIISEEIPDEPTDGDVTASASPMRGTAP